MNDFFLNTRSKEGFPDTLGIGKPFWFVSMAVRYAAE